MQHNNNICRKKGEEQRETADCSHPLRVCQQSIGFHDVLSDKVQIAASCCSTVAHL